MLDGLSLDEFNQLLLSVGRTPIARRPYSPVEVGQLCMRAIKSGVTRDKVTRALRMTDTSMISKFIRVAELPPPIQHLVGWGRSSGGAIGFSTAAQLGRFDARNQEFMSSEIIKYGLTKSEMISINQLLDRSGQPLGQCVQRVIRRRPSVTVRHVVLGAVSSRRLQDELSLMTQRQRNVLLRNAVDELYPNVGEVSANLGNNKFALVGNRSLAAEIGEDRNFEASICDFMIGRIGG